MSIVDGNDLTLWEGQINQEQTITGWDRVFVDPPIPVENGQEYKLIVKASIERPNPEDYYAWRGRTDSPYDKGITDVEGAWPGFDYGFQIFFSGPKATTNSAGYYDTKVYYGWSGRLTPSFQSGWNFNPSSIEYYNISSNKINQNYLASQELYTNIKLFFEGCYYNGAMDDTLKSIR